MARLATVNEDAFEPLRFKAAAEVANGTLDRILGRAFVAPDFSTESVVGYKGSGTSVQPFQKQKLLRVA